MGIEWESVDEEGTIVVSIPRDEYYLGHMARHEGGKSQSMKTRCICVQTVQHPLISLGLKI
jgi:hypothetical protein